MNIAKKIKNFICNMDTVQTYLGKWGKKQISATPLPQFLFFSLSLSFWGKTCILGKNFNNYITEIQFSLSPSIISFLSPLLYFFRILINCWNLLLSLFFQITFNSSHITNKLTFLRYSVKRLQLNHRFFKTNLVHEMDRSCMKCQITFL